MVEWPNLSGKSAWFKHICFLLRAASIAFGGAV